MNIVVHNGMTTVKGQSIASPVPPLKYSLHCHGCGWQVPAPTDFKMAKLLTKMHQLKLAVGRPHVVEFIHD